MIPKPLLAPFLLALFSAPAIAQESPQAWLSRLNTVVSRPIEAKQSMTRDANGTTFITETSFLIADKNHFRVSTSQKIEGRDEQGEPVTSVVELLNVADGSWLWMQVTDPVSGQGQVRRVELKEMAGRAKAAGSNFTAMHPAAFILELCELVEFESVSLEKDRVILKANFSEDAKSKLIGGFRGGVPRTLTLVLDRQTAFPVHFTVDSYHKVLVDCTFTDIIFVDLKKIDENEFVFKVPDGLSFNQPVLPPQRKAKTPNK